MSSNVRNYNSEANIGNCLGDIKNETLDISSDKLGSIITKFITVNLKIHSVSPDDIHIYLPIALKPGLEDVGTKVPGKNNVLKFDSIPDAWTISYLINEGTPIFDAVYLFALKPGAIFEVSFYKPDSLGRNDDDHNGPLVSLPSVDRLSATKTALTAVYMYLILRGGGLDTTESTKGSSMPSFIATQLNISGSINSHTKILSSFAINKVGTIWIKHINLSAAASSVITRIGLGVAGYRLFQPFAVATIRPQYKIADAERLLIRKKFWTKEEVDDGKAKIDIDNDKHIDAIRKYYPSKLNLLEDETDEDYKAICNAFNFAKLIATANVDWAIHSATRDPSLISKYGGFNDGLNNLMLKVFTDEQLSYFTTSSVKILFKVPTWKPSSLKFMSWDPNAAPELVDPIIKSTRN